MRSKHARWLIENQQARIGKQQFQNFDLLLFANGNLRHQSVRINFQIVAFRDFDDAPVNLFPVQHRLQVWQKQGDVFRYAEDRDQVEVLEHHANAHVSSVVRRLDGDRHSVKQNLACIGVVKAVQNFH